MFSLRKPSPETLRQVISEQRVLEFSYAAVGETNDGQMPAAYNVDHTRVELGKGAAAFERARSALERWEQFHVGWLEAFPNDTPLRKGETVVVVARAFPLWCTNAARIVYTIDEATAPVARFGFAYGTLPAHVERGEERFLIEWDRATEVVSFDILAFSRPRHYLVRLTQRRARALQKRFAEQSAAAMKRAVRSE